MYDNLRLYLGSTIDNSSLVFFRICFGFLAAAETIGAIFTGWVRRMLIEPDFTFSFIGFEWLQPLAGDGMIYYFAAMGILGLLIMLGLFYRVSTVLFFILWTGVYLMQKTEYNNHYYLLMLLSAIMAVIPAHKNRSLDVKFGFTSRSETCPRVCIWFFIVQVMIVYVFASTNKMHSDWLQALPIKIWFSYKTDYWLIGPLLGKDWMAYFVAWGGVFYDGLIVFLLLYKRTRNLGFALSLFFNLFNSAVFQIGIFPYLMIAFSALFYPPYVVKGIFFRDRTEPALEKKKLSNWLMIAVGLYFLIHILLPLRHHLYEGDTHWTEEGHRLSWQMMLRSKSGSIRFRVVDKTTGEQQKVKLRDYLSPRQQRGIAGKPDIVWQFAQRLKKEYADRGMNIEVYAISSLSLNGHGKKPLIDSSVDLASVPWDRWKHSDWILTYDSYD